MCGVVTVIGAGAGDRARAILDRLAARGPDGRGYHVSAPGEPELALGHARLAIVDVAGGAQPLSSEDGQVVVVANGQIYNEPALRDELAARGHTFATGSDCEVLVHLYEEHGVDMLSRLEGMFAFVLLDRRRGTVLLARDRIGEKPLAYARLAGGVSVASEVRALLADPAVSPHLDSGALASYLAFGYVPAPLAILAGVQKLPPGSYLVVDAQGRAGEPVRWWQPPDRSDPALALLPRPQLLERIEESLARSVAARLRADVPLGIFLSGGLDSSLIAALAVRAGASLPCFSLGFEGEAAGWDERPLARQVSAHLDLEHHEIVADPAALDLTDGLPAWVDEPFADSSALLLDVLVGAARPHVKVALSGEGGDELFAGYPRHRGAALAARYDHLPLALRRAVAALARRISPASPRKLSRARLASRFLASGDQPFDRRLVTWQTFLTPEMRAHVAPGLPASDGPEAAALEIIAAGPVDDPVARALRFDLLQYLPEDLLVKADRVGLGHGLEIRTPFLSTELVELGAALPGATRLPGRESKPLIRALAARILPAAVARAPKGGFSLPLGRWIAAGRLPGLESMLDPDRMAAVTPFLDARAAGDLLAAQRAGGVDRSPWLHALAVLVAWCEATGARP